MQPERTALLARLDRLLPADIADLTGESTIPGLFVSESEESDPMLDLQAQTNALLQAVLDELRGLRQDIQRNGLARL
jgi:hypothetical protein